MNEASKFPYVQAELVDPVCGMHLPPDGRFRLLHNGIEYRFCNSSCLQTFQREPEKFLNPQSRSRNAR